MFSKPGDKMWDAEYAKWVDGMHPDTMFGVKFDEVPRPLIQKQTGSSSRRSRRATRSTMALHRG